MTRILAGHEGLRILVWFVSAAVVHDLIVWPLYAIADRGAAAAARRRPDRLPAVPWINHLRVPVVLSAVMLVVSFPLVFRWSQPAYRAASGLSENPYLGRWLLLSGAAFGASAVIYAVRVGMRSGGQRPSPTAPGHMSVPQHGRHVAHGLQRAAPSAGYLRSTHAAGGTGHRPQRSATWLGLLSPPSLAATRSVGPRCRGRGAPRVAAALIGPRSETRTAVAGPQSDRQRRVGDAGVRRPRSLVGAPPAQDQVGRAGPRRVR